MPDHLLRPKSKLVVSGKQQKPHGPRQIPEMFHIFLLQC